jgi:hypothetical protein
LSCGGAHLLAVRRVLLVGVVVCLLGIVLVRRVAVPVAGLVPGDGHPDVGC